MEETGLRGEYSGQRESRRNSEAVHIIIVDDRQMTDERPDAPRLLSFRYLLRISQACSNRPMLARCLVLTLALLALPLLILVPSVHSQPAGAQIAWRLHFVQFDSNAEAALVPYLRPAAAIDGISAAPLAPGVTPADVIREAEAAGKVVILAEPSMLSNDGKEATFLAGSSLPIPEVEQDSNHVTVEHRPFGIRLNFLPTLHAAGVALKIASEASLLDFNQSITVQGVTIPAFSVRRNETQMELANGQSFVISGLVDRGFADALSRMPGVADIPLLRAMAQSTGAKVLLLATVEIQ
jgi:Bacterial type II and III secretion system protein